MDTWETKTIRDLGRVVTGKTPPKVTKDYFENGDELFVSPKDLDWDKFYVTETETAITEKALDKFKNQVIPKNSIMFTSISFAFGKIGVASKNCLTNQQINTVIVNKNHDYRFVYYLLQVYRPIIFSYNSGIDTPIVPKSVFEKIKVKCPSLTIQTRIADILFSYDDLIENNNQRIATLEAIAQQIYKEWFVRLRFPNWEHTPFHHGIPDGWEVKHLDSVLIRKNFGKTYKPNEVFQEGKVIVIDQTKGDYLGFHNSEPDHKATIDKPIILFGDHTCKMCMMINDFSLAENVIPFTSKNISEFFIFHLINGLVETTEYKRHWSELVSKSVFIPSKNLHEKFSDIVKPFYVQIKILTEQNENLTKTRNLLLPRLISGKLTLKQAEAQTL